MRPEGRPKTPSRRRRRRHVAGDEQQADRDMPVVPPALERIDHGPTADVAKIFAVSEPHTCDGMPVEPRPESRVTHYTEGFLVWLFRPLCFVKPV